MTGRDIKKQCVEHIKNIGRQSKKGNTHWTTLVARQASVVKHFLGPKQDKRDTGLGQRILNSGNLHFGDKPTRTSTDPLNNANSSPEAMLINTDLSKVAG